MQVFKFGGASVKDAEAVKNVAEILKKFAIQETIVVVSAMGKTTNGLEELVNAFFNKTGDAESVLQKNKDYHFNILKDLFSNKNHAVYNDIENTFVELNWIIEDEVLPNYNQVYDQIVSMGEIISTKIIAAYLTEKGINNKWLDARGVIQTDNTYREGKVNYELSEALVKDELVPLFNTTKIVVTQGFIGGTSENFTTTLGREGSDYTAALLAYFTNAESVTIWKDVPGVLNADPKWFKNTKKIDELTYHDAIEFTYYGATVIHPKTIKPLQNKNIPLFVKSFLKPEETGTVIHNSDIRVPIPSYIFKINQLLISIQPKDFSFIGEDNLSAIFDVFARFGAKIHLMQNSAISFSVCIDEETAKTENLIQELQKEFKVLYNSGLELLTIRNYDQQTINKLIENKTVLMEQRSRNTVQMVLANI
ncbi:MAG: aspartate kinase [Bacteroidia bacterium]|nr:aspartate kinase [Bacteroidia bacterium]